MVPITKVSRIGAPKSWIHLVGNPTKTSEERGFWLRPLSRPSFNGENVRSGIFVGHSCRHCCISESEQCLCRWGFTTESFRSSTFSGAA